MKMRNRQERIKRVAGVEREYQAAVIAAALLGEKLRVDPSFLLPSLEARDAKAMLANIEATFLIRLFAEFEAGLRDVWKDVSRKSTRPPMKVLIDRIAARQAISGPILDEVHHVRRYRNSLVHDDADSVEPLDLKSARRRLCRFLGRMPPE